MTTVREYREAFKREILHWPRAKIAFAKTAKHQKLIIRYRGKQAKRTFASTDGDHRALKNAVSDMRRTLRRFGAVRMKNANDN
ncbi:hypothetical protein [Croceicoccus bisphenolivorans]|uniref:hypothetical protein n=1 Tax=Croceicoccus bisphenolivorans TaxID=1783232 RepID=UPI00082E88E2|nr:hypothetical protein [Croceicoccus bisphenolivorans]